MTRRLPIVLLGLTIAAGASAQTDAPPFVIKLIAQYKSASPGSSPDSVWKYRYRDAMVFYVPRLACCDIMSKLYDVNGNIICHPDGGIAGSGDGKCPGFVKERDGGVLLWRRRGA
ncbi:DUF6970 domain-containing protein [Dyella dinghuensis]|uniref:DUF6970 domain-containing protein n=1 Tax=Dyella dinghuensis TaxID=1920169 RepID=UPI0026CEC960